MADEQPNPDSTKKGSGGLGSLVQAESMIQVAVTLPAACFIGWAIGTALDKHFHVGWINIVGVLLGAVAGFTQIIMMVTRLSRRGD